MITADSSISVRGGFSASRPPPICGLEAMMPVAARIVSVREENFNTRTFRLQICDPELRSLYRFAPGQFNMLYVPGVGEAAISISSDAHNPEYLEHTIRVVGSVTRAITRLGQGGVVGLRGPFGRGWPIEALAGHDIVIVAGGIGLAPLRPVVYQILRERQRFGRVVLLYGCRTPADRLYAEELEQWSAGEQIDVLVTVDNATPGWVGPVGVVMKLLQRIKVNAARANVLICGPRMLNRVAASQFLQLHVPPEQVFLSLERNMHCGFGRCGHCQYGAKFVCKDGPVFSFAEISDIFAKEEI
ncbi:FAD/NAD(P)-binding protein [Fontivita pretiosa]|jgi:NAD(P)H-flavin reductase|uniref:FAD/NAD(P)-binding protein n=1 Tax=Fontivita pretiosa TaxID=2989684 RepID=UPI003D169E0F